jgi:hypothetical protein
VYKFDLWGYKNKEFDKENICTIFALENRKQWQQCQN